MFNLDLFLKICKDYGVEPTNETRGVCIVINNQEILLDDNLAMDIIMKDDSNPVRLTWNFGKYNMVVDEDAVIFDAA